MTNGKILRFCLFTALLTYTPTRVMLEGALVSPPLCYCRQFVVPCLQREICIFMLIVKWDSL
jgi:hypothetical protein